MNYKKITFVVNANLIASSFQMKWNILCSLSLMI